MKEKLIQKRASIQEIASEIRLKSGTFVEPAAPDKEKTEFMTLEKSSLELDAYLSRIQDSQYNCTGVLYVDEEIKEVFALLKSKAKIPISSLVSLILEDWLVSHKEEVASVINSKNRFL